MLITNVYNRQTTTLSKYNYGSVYECTFVDYNMVEIDSLYIHYSSMSNAKQYCMHMCVSVKCQWQHQYDDHPPLTISLLQWKINAIQVSINTNLNVTLYRCRVDVDKYLVLAYGF